MGMGLCLTRASRAREPRNEFSLRQKFKYLRETFLKIPSRASLLALAKSAYYYCIDMYSNEDPENISKKQESCHLYGE